MEEVSFELMNAVKEVLIDMTIEMELPSDMNELDIRKVFDLAQSKLKGNEAYQDMRIRVALGEMVSMEDMDEAVEIWKGLTSVNDGDMADEHFTMWEPLEWSLTIKQMRDQI